VILGILSDTHDEVERTRNAVALLVAKGVTMLVHCGDIYGPAIISECSVLPLYFVFGNRDCDHVPLLRKAATEHGANCLGWGGQFAVGEKRIAVVHGHLTMDLKPLLDAKPDVLFSGHSHIRGEWRDREVRRINPGALAEADGFSVATLDLKTDELQFLPVP
jgi:uncharacterized protein